MRELNASRLSNASILSFLSQRFLFFAQVLWNCIPIIQLKGAIAHLKAFSINKKVIIKVIFENSQP